MKEPFASGDQSFDDRATHLQANVYGSDKGRLRLLILQRDLRELIEHSSHPLRILDAGCGEGAMTEWALAHGHQVTACDSSGVMLDALKQRLGGNKSLTLIHGSIQDLPKEQKYDLVLCHAVLEWIEDKHQIFEVLTSLVSDEGHLSVMFYNAWAREMAQLVYGNFDYIERNYAVKKRVKLNPHYPINPDEVEGFLAQNDFCVATRSGIRVFYDIMRPDDCKRQTSEAIIRHELRVNQQKPYWQMGRYVHFLAHSVSS